MFGDVVTVIVQRLPKSKQAPFETVQDSTEELSHLLFV